MDKLSTKDHPDWWKNVGGQNSQDSVLERRSLVWNDNDVGQGRDPPSHYTCYTFRGKFFPRGMRGMIERIQIYCRDAGVDTITLRYSPHPCLGPIGEITISPLAGWAWRWAVIEEMWDYDSLFIWVYECEAGVDWAYDEVEPYDGHRSTDAGATWSDLDIRPFIRVTYSGETPGDVPVSGIINNIRIPNASSEEEFAAKPIEAGVLTTIGTVEGIGYCDLVIVHVWGAGSAELTTVEIQCDGEIAFRWSLQRLNSWNFDDNTQPICLPLYQVDDDCVLMLTKMWEFRRLFEVLCENAVAAQTVSVWTYPSLLR